MPTTQLSHAIQRLRVSLVGHAAPAPTDGQLLEAFIQSRDGVAFEALVRRHGPMVMGVCRRLLGNAHSAEDAFQATFLVLIRRATAIVPREAVGSWLYGVAYRTALAARSKATRRQAREVQLAELPQRAVETDPVATELRPVLDRELNRLPDKYRVPLVLCALEGRSRQEVAGQLGIAAGTLSSRLATARKRLAQRLVRCGVAVSAGSLALMLSPGQAAAQVPAPLISATIKAATLLAAGPAASGISTPVAALMQGVLRAMFLTKLKKTAALVLFAGFLAVGVGAATRHAFADNTSAYTPTFQREGDEAARQRRVEGAQRGVTTLHGELKAVDADKGTITLSVPTRGEAAPTERKLSLAKDVAVERDGQNAQLADLKTGWQLVVQLGTDEAVARISAVGPTVSGELKFVDAAKGTVTVVLDGRREGREEKTYSVGKDARIALGERGTQLADLKPGTPVFIVLSVDQSSVVALRQRGEGGRREQPGDRPRGNVLQGELKDVDAAKGTITLSIPVRGEAVPTERKLSLGKEALVERDGQKASLADLKTGWRVAAFVGEGDTVARLSAVGATIGGELVSLDAAKGTITVSVETRQGREQKAYSLSKDIRPGQLAEIKAGTPVALTFSVVEDNLVVQVHSRAVGRRTRE